MCLSKCHTQNLLTSGSALQRELKKKQKQREEIEAQKQAEEGGPAPAHRAEGKQRGEPAGLGAETAQRLCGEYRFGR